ncbi:MAG TPA: condensation domain-containing protein, partial [Chloroflexota bacterium]|nr:condensation domain-containing protein [Chloroflexota bacterium]
MTIAEDDHLVLLTLHHIASDGWSMGVLRKELTALYEAYRGGKPNPLPPLRVQYADYAQWQRQWLQGPVLEGQLGYWRKQLSGVPAVHGLPLDRPRPAVPGVAGGRHVQRLSKELREGIEALCRQHGVTLFMLLETAFAVLLSRWSEESDIAMGTPIAGRVHQDLEPLIGFFVNTLVLRNDVSGNPTFGTLLERSKQMILDAYAHQHVPFEMLVEELEPERSLSHTPLFQILFAVQHAESESGSLGSSRVTPMGSGGGSTTVKFELELTAVERPDELALHWVYKNELFDGATIERMAAHMAVLLEAVTARPEARVGELPLLTAVEREQVLVEWNATGVRQGEGRCLHELVAERAEKQPDAVAVIDGTREVTYRELMAAARSIAQQLQKMGVGPEQVVGVAMERSWEMVATLLGVMTAGGAYLPLDASHPKARLAQVLTDSRASVVITRAELAERLPWDGPTLLLERLDLIISVGAPAISVGAPALGRAALPRAAAPTPGAAAPTPRAAAPTPQNLAYVLFTS